MMQEYSCSYGSSNSEEAKAVKHNSSLSLLHSVRKSIAKPCKKAPVAPMPPTPIKVYKVDPINFRDLVQHLTGAPEFKPQAPPPHLQSLTPFSTAVSSFVGRDIAIAASPNFSSSTLYMHDHQSEASMGFGLRAQELTAPALLELNLSSPSYNWCSSFPPMSPETMTNWELPGRVL